MTDEPLHENVRRASISLPPSLFDALDELVRIRGFHSRSQALAEMIQQNLIEYHQDLGDEVMAGTIVLFYDESNHGVLPALAQIEREHIAEVISSHHVLLEHNNTMEVLLVQGPAQTLKMISDKLITCKGVKSGKLTISSMILPPLHPLTHTSQS